MPLILAIDPDKRQSSQLASLVKSQLQAELVHRASAVEALDALKGRVPDLVLTSSLISPREDAALAAYLRDLGAAAAHVQTITIPLLGAAAPERAKGVLAALRRDKPQAAMTDGCAPDVFAEQIRQYLRTAAEHRAAAAALGLTGTEAEPTPYGEAGLHTGLDVEADNLLYAEASSVDEAPAQEPVAEIASEHAVVAAAIAIEPASLPEPAEPEAEAIADEPEGLPLSQLLQLVSDWTIGPGAPAALEAAPPADEPAHLEAHVPEPTAFEAQAEEPLAGEAVAAGPALVGELDELPLDPVAAQALEELSRQLPAAALADSIPAEAPVPVVEMQTFETLDAIASQLAAAPLPKHDSLDDLASLFAATPATPALWHTEPLASGFDTRSPGRAHEFESLFAAPSANTASAVPIEVPGVDPSLFASNAAQPPSADPPAFESLFVPQPAGDAMAAFEPIAFEPAPVEPALPAHAVAESAVREPVPVEPVLAEPTSFAPPLAEPVLLEPVPIEPVRVEPVLAEPVLAAPTFVEPVLEPVIAGAAVPEFEVVEPAAAEWEAEAAVDRSWAPAAPKPFDEEIALDVDAFDAAMAAPAAEPAAPATAFSFTFVDGFGDAWSDFEVPSVAAVAADLGLPPSGPMDADPAAPTPNTADWLAAAPPAATPAPQPAAGPVLDDEALSLIGDAARKASLDAFVIEEFERGVRHVARKPKAAKTHAGATHVTPAATPQAAKKKGPVQDEWGLFDPDQCGFAALEEEDPAERRKARDGTRVRVISY